VRRVPSNSRSRGIARRELKSACPGAFSCEQGTPLLPRLVTLELDKKFPCEELGSRKYRGTSDTRTRQRREPCHPSGSNWPNIIAYVDKLLGPYGREMRRVPSNSRSRGIARRELKSACSG